jgi:hypothetical protein
MTTLDKVLLGQGDSVYYTDGLRTVFEDMLNVFITDPNTTQSAIDPQDAYRYEGDFYGLAAKMGVPDNLHWLCMRMSGYTCSADFRMIRNSVQYLLKPSISFVNQQVNIYTSSLSK